MDKEEDSDKGSDTGSDPNWISEQTKQVNKAKDTESNKDIRTSHKALNCNNCAQQLMYLVGAGRQENEAKFMFKCSGCGNQEVFTTYKQTPK